MILRDNKDLKDSENLKDSKDLKDTKDLKVLDKTYWPSQIELG